MTDLVQAQFLADIIENPGDDTPRLIYADWLEEYGGEGRHERADFIRTQCELARWHALPCSWAAGTWVREGFVSGGELCREWPNSPPARCCMAWDEWLGGGLCRKCEAINRLQRHEEKLFSSWPATGLIGGSIDKNADTWFNGYQCKIPGKTMFEVRDKEYGKAKLSFRWRRGFIEEVSLPLEAWVGFACGACVGGDGMVTAFRDCLVCRGIGRTAAHGVSLAVTHPITRVNLNDRDPDPGGWRKAAYPTPEWGLPPCLWDLLEGYTEACATYGNEYKRFRGDVSADHSLSDACLTWARRAARLGVMP